MLISLCASARDAACFIMWCCFVIISSFCVHRLESMHIYLPRRQVTSLCHLAEGCNEDKIEDFQVQDVRKEPCKRSRSCAETLQPVKVSHCIQLNSSIPCFFRHG